MLKSLDINSKSILNLLIFDYLKKNNFQASAHAFGEECKEVLIHRLDVNDKPNLENVYLIYKNATETADQLFKELASHVPSEKAYYEHSNTIFERQHQENDLENRPPLPECTAGQKVSIAQKNSLSSPKRKRGFSEEELAHIVDFMADHINRALVGDPRSETSLDLDLEITLNKDRIKPVETLPGRESTTMSNFKAIFKESLGAVQKIHRPWAEKKYTSLASTSLHTPDKSITKPKSQVGATGTSKSSTDPRFLHVLHSCGDSSTSAAASPNSSTTSTRRLTATQKRKLLMEVDLNAFFNSDSYRSSSSNT